MTELKSNYLFTGSGEPGQQYWTELKVAIAQTSGFKRWVIERNGQPKETDGPSDTLVQLYLRQTLETLAY